MFTDHSALCVDNEGQLDCRCEVGHPEIRFRCRECCDAWVRFRHALCSSCWAQERREAS